MQYSIEVKYQGFIISEHVIEASDALMAINLVEESLYGEAATVDHVTVEDDLGRRRLMMLVNNWHGYSFQARSIDP